MSEQKCTIGGECTIENEKPDILGIPGRWLNNKKSTQYFAAEIVKHSETSEWMVLYRSLDVDGTLWVRPVDLFQEKFTRLQ